MKRAYIYPITSYQQKIIPNPYLDSFMESLEREFYFLNKEKPSNKGIFDLISYFRRTNYLFLNWIEDLPDKRGGYVQVLAFISLVYLLKWKGTKIVWTMHNKLSHYKSNYKSKRFLFRFLLIHSDFIITHSREGISYASEYNFKKLEKIRYFPHPIEKRYIRFNERPSYDILIWGSLIPYKGIDRFLEYLYNNNLESQYRILICGKVKPDDYESVISSLCNNQILLDNRYIPEEELITRIADSKTVLFTYIGNSVLSSGVLMETLSYGGDVLAPHIGAFKDAADDNLIDTFETYDDLIPLLNRKQGAHTIEKKVVLDKFIEENSWPQFARKLIEWIG